MTGNSDSDPFFQVTKSSLVQTTKLLDVDESLGIDTLGEMHLLL